MSSRLLWLTVLTGEVFGGLVTSKDRTISNSYKDTSSGACFGSKDTKTTLNEGSTVWLSGEYPHSCYGNLNILGELILSTTDHSSSSKGGMTSSWQPSDSNNGNLNIGSGGKVSCNDHDGGDDSGYRWNLTTLNNQGTLQWCGLSDTSGSRFSLTCDKSSYNYGLIDWAQYGSSASDSDCCWRSKQLKGPGQSSYDHLYNYGAFRLINTVFRGRQNIYGDGSFILGERSVLYLEDGAAYYQNPKSGMDKYAIPSFQAQVTNKAVLGPCYPDQTICFTHKTAALHLDKKVYTVNANFGPSIWGFGPGNALEFTENIQKVAYNAITGVLTAYLSTDNHPVNVKIGTGYDQASFYTGKNPSSYCKDGFNAIFYKKTAPSRAMPSKCSVSVATCTNPASTAGVSDSSTSATTASTTTQADPQTTSSSHSRHTTSGPNGVYTVDPVLATPPSRSKTTTTPRSPTTTSIISTTTALAVDPIDVAKRDVKLEL